MKRLQRRQPERSRPALQPESGETDVRLDAWVDPSANGLLDLSPGAPLDDSVEADADLERTTAGDFAGRLLLEVAETPANTGEGLPALHLGFDPLYPADGFGSDADLVERARSDPEAFGLLYERYVDRIYSYCYHRVGNAQDAEDLTARTFHRALDALDHYEERGLPFAAWLFRIAHNLVANWHRDRSRRRFLSLDRIWSQRSEDDDPEGELERKETHDALWRAINRLPADRRDLLLYKFSSQMSNVEIGGVLKKSESAIKSLYFRTLAALRKDLEASGWGSDDPSGPSGPSVPSDPVDENAEGDLPALPGIRSPFANTEAEGETGAPGANVPHADIADLITPPSDGAQFSR